MNFFSDTPFIEVLCVLIILKMYGNRRETITARIANMAAVLVIFVDSIVTMFAQRSLTRFLIIICLPLLVLFGMAKILRPDLPSGLRRNPSKGLKKSLAFSIGAIIVNILLAAAFILPADRIQPNQIVTVICLTNTSLYFLYYIFEKLSPAQSRAQNRPCIFLSFFDYHDLWHITSSLASLVTLMAVSTLDDAVSSLPTNELSVF
ncbi:hypothetical protein COOONC_11305 [Cooperia oncophora]